MATLYFQLERSKTLKDDTHPIFLVLKLKEQGKEKRFRYYTGRSALEKHWIGEGESKRVSSKAAGAGITNDRLETLRSGADAIITNAKNIKADFTLEYFKERFYHEVIGRVKEPLPQPKQVTFFEHLQKFIEAKENVLQPATIKTYITLKNSLQEFEKVMGYKVEFETINHTFITLYTKYLIEDTGVLNNTLAKRIATLKGFLNDEETKKINTCKDYENFKASRDLETTIMYLTEQELMQLYNLETKPNSTEQHIKDAFCFACFTGIRFSDWAGLKPEHIQDVNYEQMSVKALKFTMFKVHKKVTVPLNKYALAIIEKYQDYSASHGHLFSRLYKPGK
jgi:integrase